MPSKEDDPRVATGQTFAGATSQDFLSRDVDELVAEIKENLRLGSLKTNRHNRHHRSSPYKVPPSRSWGGSNAAEARGEARRKKEQSEDPYELLQELLREGSLIKEAVRRLQAGLSPKQRTLFCDLEDAGGVGKTPVAICGVDV